MQGFAGASLAFVPSWFRILEGTLPAWILAAHAVTLTAAAFWLSRRREIRGGEILGLCFWAAVVPSVFLMGLRAHRGPAWYVHDSAVLSEESARFLLRGQNPYAVSFAGTPMADVPFFGGWNPAIEHYVYYPGSFVLAVPLVAPMDRVLGYYDHRIFLLLCYGLGLLAAWHLADAAWRPHLLVALGLNPAFVFYLVQGANDSGVVGLLTAALTLEATGWVMPAAAAVGLACGTKQTAWFFAPLFLSGVLGRFGWRRGVAAGLVLVTAMGLLTVPFLLWDLDAFVEDTYRYLTGTAKDSYPVAGLSVSALLKWLGITVPPRVLFPALQLGLVLPVLLGFCWAQMRRPVAGWLAFRYSIAVAVSFLCGRYVNASHLSYVSVLLFASWLMPGGNVESMEPDSPGEV